MLNFLVLALISSFSLPGFCQEETKLEPLSENGAHVIIRGTSEAPSQNPAPAPSIEEDSEENLRKQIEAAQPAPFDPIAELKKLGYDEVNAKALMDKNVIAILRKTVNEGQMDKLSVAEIKAQIKDRVEGSWMESVFKRFPKLLDVFADFLREKKALDGLLGIVARKDDLKTYGYTWLVIFLAGIYIKHRLIKPTWEFGRRFKWSFSISFALSVLSIYIFYNKFSVELDPTLSIISKHLF